MVDYAARIKELEDELRNTAYNKRTQHSIGLLKAKISRTREKAQARASKGGGGYTYSVRKSGDASVVLVGYPSVGKSTLLNELTNADSEIGEYAFTTLDVVPGLLEYKHAQIQVLDVPGILKGAAIGKGRGKEVLSVIRNANMVLFLIDVKQPKHYKILFKEVYDSNMRVNQRKPDVKIIKKARGGIHIGTTVKLTHLTKKTAETILREFKISNADVVIRSNITPDQFIDVIENNKHYIPGLIVLTKVDLATDATISRVKKSLKADISVSSKNHHNIEKLKELMYKKLDFISVFCKEIGKKADMDVPLIMYKGSTARDVCNKLHKDFAKNFKCVKVWGPSGKFPGQRLGIKHVLKDGDVVEIHTR